MTDRFGRITLLLPARARIAIRVVHGESLLVRAIETSAAADGAKPASSTFELGEPASIRGRVVDRQGKPVANTKVTGLAVISLMQHKPIEFGYTASDAWSAESGNRIRVIEPKDRDEADILTAFAIPSSSPTDAEGRFALAMPRQAFNVALMIDDSVPKAVEWNGQNMVGVTVQLDGQ